MPGVSHRGSALGDAHLQQDLALPPVLDADSMENHAESAASLLKALANPKRLMILYALTSGELKVGVLHERIELSQSALSQHLSVLRQQGLVKTRRHAQTIYYSLADGIATKIINLLYDHYHPRFGVR